MIYPIFVLVMFLVVIIIMVVVVIPQLEGIITESGITPDELPTISKIMFGVGSFLKNYYLGIIAAIAVIAIVVVNYFKSEEAQGLASTIFLNFPVIGNFLKKLYISRFAETLSVLIKGGIPIVSALEISANVIGNNFYEDVIFKIAQGVKEGGNMSSLIMNYPDFFPPVVSQMMAVGERTGTLDEILNKIAKNYTREVDELAGSLAEIIQPILIVFLGILVGLLVAGVIMPIYQIAQQF
jgi:type IV pilus assembly protein PilC